MYKIAVYGKGGVGKSTLASNLSLLLSRRGLKVLHVGCDPKHDSTRLLTGGVPQKTFLDALIERREDGIVVEGLDGVRCAECGGAEPGIGCAGKGMLSMFTYIDRNTPSDTDVRICDVLGDVVCGGFSVPMRRENVDGIIIVTSEEFMSLYAANNILRGLRNLNGTPCVLGLVLNSRDPADRERVLAFAAAAGLPILGEIARSADFSQAERLGEPVAAVRPDSEAVRELGKLADRVQAAVAGELRPVPPRPLNDRAMTDLAAGRPIADTDPPAVRTACRFDAYDRERQVHYKGDFVMPACTSHGAVELLLAVRDAAVVLHGPRNCAFLMEYAWRRREVPSAGGQPLAANLYSTGMDGTAAFSGDAGIVRQAVERAVGDGFRYVFVVPTCTPETIGTDLPAVCGQIDIPGAAVIPVAADPVFLGSKFGNYAGALKAMAGMMDWQQAVVPDTINLFAFEPDYMIIDRNRQFIDRMLRDFGLTLNSFMVNDLTVAAVKRVPAAQYNLQVHDHPLNRRIVEIVLDGRRGCPVLDTPYGLHGELAWIETLARLTGRVDRSSALREQAERRYARGISRLQPQAAGKKALIFTREDTDLSWELEVLVDLGMEVLGIVYWKTRFLEHRDDKTGHPEVPRFTDVELCGLPEIVERCGADVLISSDSRVGKLGFRWAGVTTPLLGVDGALNWAQRVVAAFAVPPQDGWRGAAA